VPVGVHHEDFPVPVAFGLEGDAAASRGRSSTGTKQKSNASNTAAIKLYRPTKNSTMA